MFLTGLPDLFDLILNELSPSKTQGRLVCVINKYLTFHGLLSLLEDVLINNNVALFEASEIFAIFAVAHKSIKGPRAYLQALPLGQAGSF